MSGFVLKVIAMLTMLIDHTGAILIPQSSEWHLLFRGIGRLAFPIYCFLLVEGYFHTKDVKKYLKRLGIFALISEIPFDMAFSNQSTNLGFLYNQNIFFTLFIGLTVIHMMHLIETKFQTNVLISNVLDCFVIIVGCLASIILFTDYNMLGVLIIISFYVFRNRKIILTILLLLLNFEMAGGIQVLSVLSMVFIWFYNGKKGTKINRYFFYAFYPIHIILLLLIKYII